MSRWDDRSLVDAVQHVDPHHAGRSAFAVQSLGALAPWWLDRAVLDSAARRPSPPAERLLVLPGPKRRGDCILPLLVWKDADGAIRDAIDRKVLRAAFALPMEWREGPRDDPALPAGFRDLAERVRGQMGEHGLSLHLHFSLFGQDLSPLPAAADSAWAILAAGLETRRRGRGIRPEVLATASFEEGYGPRGVESVGLKVQLALELGARRIFVAEESRHEAVVALGARPGDPTLEVVALPHHRQPSRALEPLFAALELPPAANAPLVERTAHYSRQRKHAPDDAADFYERMVLPDLLERCAKRSQAGLPETCLGGTLFSFLSQSPEGSRFAAHALKARRAVLFCTRESQPMEDSRAARALNAIRAETPTQATDIVLLGPANFESARARAAEIAVQIDGGPIVLDVTPGPKDIAFGMWKGILDSRPRDAHAVYLSHSWVGGERVPDTETLIYLPLSG